MTTDAWTQRRQALLSSVLPWLALEECVTSLHLVSLEWRPVDVRHHMKWIGCDNDIIVAMNEVWRWLWPGPCLMDSGSYYMPG